MTRFAVEIELGNDQMQTNTHIAAALEDVQRKLMALGGPVVLSTNDDDSPLVPRIRDLNGNTVGGWRIDEQPLSEWVPTAERGGFFS